MSDSSGQTFEDAATMVHGLGPQPHGAEVVALPEVVQGRLILRAYGVQAATEGDPGNLDPFQDQHFT